MIKKKILQCLVVLFTLLSCSEDKSGTAAVNDFIPAETTYMFQIPEFASSLQKIDSLAFLQDNNFFIAANHKQQLEYLSKYIKNKTVLISLTHRAENSFDYTVISEASAVNIETDTVANRSVETFKYEDFSIKKYSLQEVEFYTLKKDGIFLASNSRNQLETIVKERNDKAVKPFSKEYTATDASKPSLFINYRKLDTLLNTSFPGNNLPLEKLAGGSLMDVDISGQKILFNGIATWHEDEQVLLKAFHNVAPVQNELASITPADASGFYSFTFNDFETLHQNLTTGRDAVNLPENHFLHYTREAGMIFTSNGRTLVLTATDPVLAKEANIFPKEIVKVHRNVEISRFTDDPGLKTFLHPLIPGITETFFVHLDNFILISEEVTFLENLISNYLNGTTLAEQEHYKDAMENLAGASSLLLVANSENFKQRLSKLASGNVDEVSNKLDLSSYPLLALQFVQERNFAHIHGIFNTTQSNKRNGTGQIAAIQIKNSIATTPALLKNHNNNETEVAFQDDENNLHLFSSGGNQLWKKELDARINSPIYQVDLYKNGNLQLAFSTPFALHVLDRNGNNVKPFPLKFRDEVTQPLSIFDYDNNRTYRFVITQGRDVLMYDSRGRLVKGFDFKRTGTQIVQAPKHIRIRRKDYIVVPESSGKLHILSRQGTSRVGVSEKFSFSDNEWFLHENNFVSVDENAQLIRITEAAKVSREAIPNPIYPAFAATNKVRVIQSENTLRINGREVILDFGLYNRPQVFEVGNENFVGITDTQAQKVYILNEEAELLPGFPVYGTSAIDIRQARNGERVLAVKGEDN
ncbi:MAG TPA: hypothetical protein VK941_10515, partial [Gillisia sp.]|nr:hypothetical protein [Gillisia sp.]